MQGSPSEVAARLLEIVERTSLEAQPGRGARMRVSAQSRFGRDLGMDSMTRAELLLRVEREFAVDLPARALEAETPAALIPFLLSALGKATAALSGERFPEPSPAEGEPLEAATLGEALAWHLEHRPERTHLYVYGDGDSPELVGYQDLHRTATRVAAGFSMAGVQPGDRVALMLPTGVDYFAAFIGALYAAAVPVPIYPPARAAQLEEHLRRHGRILANAGVRALVTVPEARRLSRLLQAQAPALANITTVAALVSEQAVAPVPVVGGDLGLLQYTSGSTGEPKGVMLSHAQILANIRAMGARLNVSGRDVFVSWLPLYHDMGLIGAWLGSLYFGIPLIVMSPLEFLARPLRWLQLIDRHHGSISGGPNFGFELCLRALDAQQSPSMDLSSWRVAFNGAEPVSPVTIERFQQALRRFGLRREALMPVYGLAEAAVGLCIPPSGRRPVIDRVDRQQFTRHGIAEPATAMQQDALLFCGSGAPLDGYELRVVDDRGRELPDRREGELEFRGPSATDGYFNNPVATQALHHGDWLVTGDRGYTAEGEVFVSGRSKDVIIRGGRNLYPYELEEVLGAVPGLRKGCVTVFGDNDPDSGGERLIVVAETRERDTAALSRLRTAIHDEALDVLGVPADDVRLVPPHSVLKTSSGKVRRAATRELYRMGKLAAGRPAIWQQLARLATAAAASRLRQAAAKAGAHFYAAYAWCVFGVSVAIVWFACLVLPRLGWRWRCARAVARGAATVAGVRIERSGIERLPKGTPYILVANHASYIDALVLAATIPDDLCFVAKSELAHRRPAGTMLRRLGVLFVERFDTERASADAQRVLQSAAAGASLAFFAEGTLSRQPGLRPFSLGAFVTAARCRLPLVPVALRGTRSVLRGDELYPRRARISVSVGEALSAAGEDWHAALELRDRARAHILAECGEPDLVHAATAVGPESEW